MIAEFKLERDLSASYKWEDTPVHKTRDCTEAEANAQAQVLACLADCQVRWNWQGLLQGHYVTKQGVIDTSKPKTDPRSFMAGEPE